MASPISALRKKHHYGRYAIVKNLIKDKGQNLLDIGCGAPARCMKEGSYLRDLGYGQGIDIEPRTIEFPFKIGDIMDIPHADGQFDVVTALEVMEHIDRPLVALQEIHRILKENGTFVMTTPNNTAFFKTFWWFWEKSFGNEWNHTHLTEYKKEEWVDIIKKNGLFNVKRVIDYWHINTIIELQKNHIVR